MKNKLFEGIDKKVYRDYQKYVNQNQDLFMYETDDYNQFNTLDEALKYVNGNDGNEASTITRVQVMEDDNGNTIPEQVMWNRKEGRVDEKLLKEGTSNFRSLDGGLPLLAFYTMDEVWSMMDYDEDNPRNHEEDYASEDEMENAYYEYEQKYFDKLDACVLDESDLDELKEDLDDLNDWMRSKAYELDDKAYDLEYASGEREETKESEHLYDQEAILNDLKFDIESGYYAATQIDCENDDEFENLDDEYKKEILAKLKEIKKRYNLTSLGVSARFSNGETWYNTIKDEALKARQHNHAKSLKESSGSDTEYIAEFKFNGRRYEVEGIKYATRTYHHEVVKVCDLDIPYMSPDRVVGSGDYKWMNRPWERFTYADALIHAVINWQGEQAREDIENAVESSNSCKEAIEKFIGSYGKKFESLKEENVDGKPKESDYKKLAKKHKASNKKGAMGSFEHFGKTPKSQNTDPKRNMELFNHAMGSDVATADGGVGECTSCGESLKEGNGNKDYNQLFLDFLGDTEFELVKCDDSNRKAKSSWNDEENEGDWALIDLQGGNLADIESDRFNNAGEILERMDAYINDYYLSDEEWGDYNSVEDLLKNNPDHPCYDVLDMIANHYDDVDLNKVYEMQGGSHQEVGTAVYVVGYSKDGGEQQPMYLRGKEIALHCDEKLAQKYLDTLNRHPGRKGIKFVMRREAYAPANEYNVWEKEQIEDEIADLNSRFDAEEAEGIYDESKCK